MLTSAENDMLCRVENGAPMGEIFRRHWIPACLSEEVSEPDGNPVKIRLLGEDLVVFRDSEGKLGISTWMAMRWSLRPNRPRRASSRR